MEHRLFWDRYLRTYDALRGFGGYQAALEGAERQLEIRPGARVLDAGSGTGNLAVALRRRGARVVGLDLSSVALGLHRAKDRSAGLVRASLEEPLPFADRAFDRVACLSVLFALSREGTRRALREFRRALRPGGRLVVTAMRPGASKIGAALGHLRARWRALPPGAFLRETWGALGSLLRVLYYNFRMRGLARQGGYRRIGTAELAAELAEAGFVGVRCGRTEDGLFHLVRAHAPVERRERARSRRTRALRPAARPQKRKAQPMVRL